MSINDDNLLFSSNWDIDQIYLQGETNNISAPTGVITSTLLTSFNLGYIHDVDIVYKKINGNVWSQPGDNINNFTLETVCYFSINFTGLYFVVDKTFASTIDSYNVRWHITADKVDY